MKRWLTTSLLMSTLVCAVAHEPPPEPDAPKGVRGLKILTWNIYMLPRIVPLKGQMRRAEAIADTLANCDFDIVVFQEAFHRGAVRTLRLALAGSYPYMYGPFNEPSSSMGCGSGVWVVSRIPLEVRDSIAFTTACSFDRAARKGAALLEGEVGGQRFQLVGTHMQADDHPEVREAQVRQLYAGLLAPYRCEGVPQIICGDMNTKNGRAAEYHAMLEGLNAEDGVLQGPQQLSYDAGTNSLADKVWAGTRTTIDYVLLRLNGAVIGPVTRRISVIKHPWRKRQHDLSDHYGVVCELWLP